MTQKKFGQYSEDLIERAREIFLANPELSFAELSRQSANLLGFHIELDSLKEYAAKGNWAVQRSALQGNKSDTDIISEVNIIREILFSQILAESRTGLLITGNFDKEEIAHRLSGLDIKIVEFSPRGVDPQLVNAYMNCLQKAGIKLEGLGTSAKTSRQQIIEQAQEEIMRLKD
jgi:hypothetical protein